jgi:sterol-4alpha-carboxylate 3-dehydrogenase (decarboxylating)
MLLQFIIGDGKNCDDFVYVENVVHGHICADTTLSTIEGAKPVVEKYILNLSENSNFYLKYIT